MQEHAKKATTTIVIVIVVANVNISVNSKIANSALAKILPDT